MMNDKEKEEIESLFAKNPGFKLYLKEKEGFSGEWETADYSDLKSKYNTYISNSETMSHYENLAQEESKTGENTGNGTLTVDSIDHAEGQETPGTPKDTTSWQNWAREHNYLFEDLKEENFDYSFNLYKTEEDKTNKNPSSTVKGKGDALYVKSDDLEVYREIAKQARAKDYTSINLLGALSREQVQMMTLAALEQGLSVTGNIGPINLDKDIFKDLSEESKKLAQDYNNKICSDKIAKDIDAAIKASQEFKNEHPEGVIGYKDIPNDDVLAINIYAATITECKFKNPGFVLPSPYLLKYLPKEHKQAFTEIINKHNEETGKLYADQAKETIDKLEKGEKVEGLEKITTPAEGENVTTRYKITEKDPIKRALLFVTIVANQGEKANNDNRPIFEPEAENITENFDRIWRYFPENLGEKLKHPISGKNDAQASADKQKGDLTTTRRPKGSTTRRPEGHDSH